MAVYDESVGESLTASDRMTFRQMYNVLDPSTGAVILKNFGGKTPEYTNATTAYEAWAAELGVSATGTDVVMGTSSTSYVARDLNFAPVDGSAFEYLLITGGYGLMMWKTAFDPAVFSTGMSVNSTYEYSTVTVPYTNFPTNYKGFLSLGPWAGLYYQPQAFLDFKLRQSGEVVIITYRQVSSVAPTKELTVAWRVRPGSLELVFTPLNSVTEVSVSMLMFNTANTGVFQRWVQQVETVAGDTRHYISDDVSNYRGNVGDSLQVSHGTTTPAVEWTLDSPLTSDINFDFDTYSFGWVKTITNSPQFSDTAAYTWRVGPIVEDVLRAQDATVQGLKYAPTLTDRPRLIEAIVASFPKVLSDTTGVQAVVSTTIATTVLERLGLAHVIAGPTKYYPALVQALRVTDTLAKFFSLGLSDTVGIASTSLQNFAWARSATDTVGIAAVLQQRLIFRVVVADDVDIDAIDALKLVYKPTLTDTVEISAAYLSPGNTFTTWVVNTGTGAVTEYSNYVFNSFAPIGNRYLGASDSGLYELDGNSDHGVSIIADIKSGLMQFGGSKFTSFKAIYLGVRTGTPDYVLRLETGSGDVYNYAVKAHSMQTTKVLLGKGLRARYFSYELISTGQDFDLDSIEFVPVVAQRRV